MSPFGGQQRYDGDAGRGGRRFPRGRVPTRRAVRGRHRAELARRGDHRRPDGRHGVRLHQPADPAELFRQIRSTSVRLFLVYRVISELSRMCSKMSANPQEFRCL